MKKVFVLLTLLISNVLFSQPAAPQTPVPLDGGLGILFLAGVVYTIKVNGEKGDGS